ncbi:unnamed protein product, partial [Prorocentrum cordatum]
MSNCFENYPGIMKPTNTTAQPSTMQTFIAKNPDNTRSLLKNFTPEKDNNIKYSDAFQLRHGAMYQDSKRKGFDCIREHGSNANMDNKALEFAEMACDSPDTPIYGWRKALVERSCLDRGKSTAAARKQSFKHLAMWHVRRWFLMCVLSPILGLWWRHALIFIGESGFGQSRVAKLLTRLFSMWHAENDGMGEEPGFRLCNSFEHLRHEVGRRDVSEVFDDSDLEQRDQAKLKAFHDNTEQENRTVITANTACDENALPSDADLACCWPVATAQQFYDAVRPSFHPNLSKKNWMALFKRSSIVLFDKRGVLCRPAGIEDKPVPFVAYQIEGKPDILTDECKQHY